MASQIATLVALLASLLILNDSRVYGGNNLNDSRVYGENNLSIEEDLELEAQLKRLNKPAVKTIKTKNGEIIDCVDFFEQPALDHPLLKEHKAELLKTRLIPRPSWDPAEASSSSSIPRSSGTRNRSALVGLEGEGCPPGTVPIRRTTKEDLIRWKSISFK